MLLPPLPHGKGEEGDGGIVGSFWTPLKKHHHQSSMPKKPKITPVTKVSAPQETTEQVEDEVMAEVKPPAPTGPTPSCPIPAPLSNSPPSMENLLTLFPSLMSMSTWE